jgi:antitoxin YefM
METISYSDLRERLKTKLDEVAEGHDPLIITRQKGKDMVIMSLEDYNSFIETIYLLGSPKNSEHLQKSIKQAEEGLVKEVTLENLKSREK